MIPLGTIVTLHFENKALCSDDRAANGGRVGATVSVFPASEKRVPSPGFESLGSL